MRDMEAAICAVGPAMHGAMLARVLQHCGLSLDKVAVITGKSWVSSFVCYVFRYIHSII